MLILNLPDELLCEIYSEWLNLRELAKFENSFTNWRKRKLLLNMLASEVVLTCDLKIDTFLLYWISIRNIKLNHLCMRMYCFHNNQLVHTIDCSRVKSLEFVGLKSSHVIALMNMCPNLREIDFDFMIDDNNMTHILPLINTVILFRVI